MDVVKDEDISGPSSLSSDQASLCVIPDPDDSSEEDGFTYLDKSSLPASLNISEQDRTVIVFHSVDEEYRADRDIVCQYIRPDGWEEGWKDAIYLFRVGWVTHRDFICAVNVSQPSNDPIGRVFFSERILPKDTANLYQFCYLRDHILLGASTPFQFTLPDLTCEKSEPSLDADLLSYEMVKSEARSLSSSCISGFSDNARASLETVQPCTEEKAEFNLQCCEDALKPNQMSSGITFLNAVYTNPEVTGCCSDSNEVCISTTFCGDGTVEDQKVDPTEALKESAITTPQKEVLCSDMMSMSTHVDQEKESGQQPSDAEVVYLKECAKEAVEEKKWFEEQYNSLLITTKKFAEDLAAERAEKELLNGRIADLTSANKKLCSENDDISKQLEAAKKQLKYEAARDKLQAKQWEDKFHHLTSENKNLIEKLSNLPAAQVKYQTPLECKCEDYQNQIETLTNRLSDLVISIQCLEVELQQEINMGQEREAYLGNIEAIKMSNLHTSFNVLGCTPTSSTNAKTMVEMEEIVNSTLEALEVALKEMAILRTRKAAVNRANRVLREEFNRREALWDKRNLYFKLDSDSKLALLQKQLKDETASKLALQKQVEALTAAASKPSETTSKQEDILEAVEAAKRDIEALHQQRSDLDRQCTLLKQKFEKEDAEAAKDLNDALLKSLEEARDEYKKLYAEKAHIQDKLARLQQKVKTKKRARAQPETTAIDTAEADFFNTVSSSWSGFVDELM